MWKRQIDLPTKSIKFDRCSSTMTGVLVLTVWRRHFHILPCKAGTILNWQKFSTYYPLPINGQILAESIFYASSIVRRSHFSTLCHHRYIIWEKPMSAKSAEVSNSPHSEMNQKISEFPTLDSYSVHKLKTTGDTKLVDWCSDTIRMYSLTVYSLNFTIGYRTTINHFTALHLLSFWDFIAR